MADNLDTNQPPRRINVKQVGKIYGKSVATIWRWSRQGIIPRPVKIGGSTGWLESEIHAHARSPSQDHTQMKIAQNISHSS